MEPPGVNNAVLIYVFLHEPKKELLFSPFIRMIQAKVSLCEAGWWPFAV